MQHLRSSSSRPIILPPLERYQPEARQAIQSIYKEAQVTWGDSKFGARCVARTVSLEIIKQFDVLIKSARAHDNHMPEQLQEALVILIVCLKEKGDFFISEMDVLAVLELLKENASEEIKEFLNGFLENDQQPLLDRGIECYCQQTKSVYSDVVFNPDSLGWNTDMHLQILSQLSFKEQYYFGSTCRSLLKTHQDSLMVRLREVPEDIKNNPAALGILYKKKPACRAFSWLPVDPEGIDYMQKKLERNCGPLTIAKIKTGELASVDEVKAYLAERRKEKLGNTDTANLGFLEKYLVDGSLTKDDILSCVKMAWMHINPDGTLGYNQNIDNPEIQQFIDSGQITPMQAIQARENVNALTNKGVQEFIRRGLITAKRICENQGAINDALCDEKVQTCIEKGYLTVSELLAMNPDELRGLKQLVSSTLFHTRGLVGERIDVLQFCAAPNFVRKVFLIKKNQHLLIDEQITVRQIFDVTKYASAAFCNGGVQNLVKDELVTVQQIFDITKQASLALCDNEIYAYIEERRIIVPQILGITPSAAIALLNKQIQFLIDVGFITVPEVLALTWDNPCNLTNQPWDLLLNPANAGIMHYLIDCSTRLEEIYKFNSTELDALPKFDINNYVKWSQERNR